MNTTVPLVANYAELVPAKSSTPAAAKWRIRRLPWGRLLAGAALAAVVAAAAALIHHAAGFESTDDAFLAGDVHPVSARINGTVSKVLVGDNAVVRAGDPLVEIDPADLNLTAQGAAAELAQAQANLVQVTAQIARAGADAEAATARIAQNAAELTRVGLDFHRVEMLADDHFSAVSAQELDAARATFDAARAASQALVAELASAQAGLAAAEAQRTVAQAQIQKSGAALATAKLQVEYTIIRAPNAGRVAKKNVEVGQRLQPGQPVLAVVDEQVWVVANFKENQLARLHPGEKVAISVDALEGRQFEGTVESFAPGTGAEFSLLPPDNATGNFTKVVQRLPVKILFSPAALAAAGARFAPGLSANVSVSVRD
jgi:membrane fusion protein (multidrug efflux system)